MMRILVLCALVWLFAAPLAADGQEASRFLPRRRCDARRDFCRVPRGAGRAFGRSGGDGRAICEARLGGTYEVSRLRSFRGRAYCVVSCTGARGTCSRSGAACETRVRSRARGADCGPAPPPPPASPPPASPPPPPGPLGTLCVGGACVCVAACPEGSSPACAAGPCARAGPACAADGDCPADFFIALSCEREECVAAGAVLVCVGNADCLEGDEILWSSDRGLVCEEGICVARQVEPPPPPSSPPPSSPPPSSPPPSSPPPGSPPPGSPPPSFPPPPPECHGDNFCCTAGFTSDSPECTNRCDATGELYCVLASSCFANESVLSACCSSQCGEVDRVICDPRDCGAQCV